jgi:ribonuclease HI
VALVIHVDGGSRGNPGPAGAGVVVREDGGGAVFEAGFFLGHQTNNAAEYHALLRALERVGQCPPQPIVIHSDSELLVRQLTGVYQVKSPKLAPLFRQVQMQLLRIAHWSIRHVPREENTRADALANLAMDAGRDVVLRDTAAGIDRAGSAAESESAPDARTSRAPAGPLAGPGAAAVRVTLARPPAGGACPAGGPPHAPFTVQSALPAGLCVHAAHALLPTLLGILNTDPEEFAAVPTLTVRCGRPGCHAEFKLSPVRSSNGAPGQSGSGREQAPF